MVSQKLRDRVATLREAADSIEALYGGFIDLIEDCDLEVRLGDVLYVPESMEDQKWALWEVVMMLNGFATQLETQLKDQELAALTGACIPTSTLSAEKP